MFLLGWQERKPHKPLRELKLPALLVAPLVCCYMVVCWSFILLHVMVCGIHAVRASSTCEYFQLSQVEAV